MPANNTAATAIDIGTLTGYTPYTTSQDAWNGAGVDDLWYSYLPVAGDDMLEVYAYGNGTTVLTSQTIRSGPPPAAIALANSGTAVSVPAQQDIVTDVTPGEHVFFKFIASNVNPAVVHIRIARGQKELIVDRDLYINDSSPGFPGVVMDPATAIPKRYSLNYPAGEGQDILQSGVVAVTDAFVVGGPVLYDVTSTGFTVRATPTMPATGYIETVGSNQIDTFVAVKSGGGGTHASIVPFDADGVVGSAIDLGSAGCSSAVPNSGYTKAYFIKSISSVNVPVFVVDTVSLVVSTFLAGVATKFYGANLLIMTDDTLLIPYEKALTDTVILRYDESANLLNTITLTGVQNALERIFADPDDPNFFWVWWQTTVLNRFQRIRVSDGVVVTDLSRNKFVESVSQTTVLAADTVYSGADFSCVPIVLRLSTPPPPSTGTMIRLTQLPLEVAYDYAMLQLFIKGGGLDWVTPPKALT